MHSLPRRLFPLGAADVSGAPCLPPPPPEDDPLLHLRAQDPTQEPAERAERAEPSRAEQCEIFFPLKSFSPAVKKTTLKKTSEADLSEERRGTVCVCVCVSGRGLTELAGAHVLQDGVRLHLVVARRADGGIICEEEGEGGRGGESGRGYNQLEPEEVRRQQQHNNKKKYTKTHTTQQPRLESV